MYTLYIGNKNYSSWSLRPWVLMRQRGIAFREQPISLGPGLTARILAASPSARVPCLHDGNRMVWDSLSIAEYLAERHPGLWPADDDARAWARSVSAEMHTGFAELRTQFGMNLRVRMHAVPTAQTAADIARIEAIWREGRRRFGTSGEFLCGEFGIVDAFWCPVAFRFHSYGVAPAGAAGDYLAALLALPAMQAWAADAARKTEVLDVPGAAAQA
jgi:glutathione S-transferase